MWKIFKKKENKKLEKDIENLRLLAPNLWNFINMEFKLLILTSTKEVLDKKRILNDKSINELLDFKNKLDIFYPVTKDLGFTFTYNNQEPVLTIRKYKDSSLLNSFINKSDYEVGQSICEIKIANNSDFLINRVNRELIKEYDYQFSLKEQKEILVSSLLKYLGE